MENEVEDQIGVPRVKDEDTQMADRKAIKNEWSTQSCFALAGGFLSLFGTIGFGNAFGIFQEYYKTHQLSNKSEFDIVWIGAFQSFILFAFAPLAGIIADRGGPFVPLCIGSVGLLLGVFMTSLCSEYYQFFLAQALLVGMGMSFLTIPCLSVISRIFVRNRGLALGIVIAGSSIGGVVWPIEIDNLLNSDGLGFGWTMRIVGFTMIPICGFVVTTLGLLSKQDEEHQPAESAQDSKADFSIVKNPAFIFLCIGLSTCFLGFWSPFFFVTSYGVDIGMSTSFSFYLPSIACAASFFGRTIPGYFADRYGPFNILVLANLFAGIVAFCWTAADSVGGVVVWALAYGFASGSLISLQSTCAAKVSTPQTHGAAQGLVIGAGALTGLFGPPIAGELLSKGYLALSMYCGATLVVGALFFGTARLKQSRNLFAIV